MSRKDAVFCLVVLLLCITFVPVWLFFGLSESIVPLSAVFFDSSARVLGWLPGRSLNMGVLLYGVLYTAVFASLAVVFTKVTRSLSRRTMLISRLGLCCVLISVSALPLLTRSDLSGKGGSYSFWTAIPRYFEKHIK